MTVLQNPKLERSVQQKEWESIFQRRLPFYEEKSKDQQGNRSIKAKSR
jgi:hypothetical protein